MTDRPTRDDNYRNPRCACAPRDNEKEKYRKDTMEHIPNPRRRWKQIICSVFLILAISNKTLCVTFINNLETNHGQRIFNLCLAPMHMHVYTFAVHSPLTLGHPNNNISIINMVRTPCNSCGSWAVASSWCRLITTPSPTWFRGYQLLCRGETRPL